MNRNHFLKLTGTLVACQPFSAAASALTSMRDLPIRKLHRSMFEKQLNTKFTVRSKDGTKISAKLVEVNDGFLRKQTIPDPQKEKKFSLLFRIPDHTGMEQDSYKFYHPGIGHFEIFITSTEWNGNKSYCEAIFN